MHSCFRVVSVTLLLVALSACGSGNRDATSDARSTIDVAASVDATSPADVLVPTDARVIIDADAMPDASAPAPESHRVSGRAVVKLLSTDPSEPWWLDEQLAPFTMTAGDFPTGIRRIVRRAPGTIDDVVVWEPDSTERLTDAVRHPSGAWSAVLYDGSEFPFLVRGDASGHTTRVAITDDTDDSAANGPGPTPPLTLLPLGERGLHLVADGEDVVVVLSNAASAVLAYRYAFVSGAWQKRSRTLVTPAAPSTPELPTSGSYDVFEAIWNRRVPHIAIDPDDGSTYVAIVVTPWRLTIHNAVFGTHLVSLSTGPVQPRADSPWDIMIARVDRDGVVAFWRVLGNVDVDDDVYAVAVGNGEVAAVGRSRRYPGFDNTELDVVAAVARRDGTEVGVFDYDAVESGIAQSAAFDRDGSLLVGGTEAWTMNPEGLSVFTDGVPFVRRLQAGAWTSVDDFLPSTTGHAEVRAIVVDGARAWIAGLDNGPLTHTADGDLSRLRADGYWSWR